MGDNFPDSSQLQPKRSLSLGVHLNHWQPVYTVEVHWLLGETTAAVEMQAVLISRLTSC